MSVNLAVEALIASPPTSKCEETMQILEELIRRHPDELHLVVYKRGIDIWPSDASNGMKLLMQKGSPVPAVVVDNNIFTTCKLPNPEELEALVQEILLRKGGKAK
jgi:hypothetical protein